MRFKMLPSVAVTSAVVFAALASGGTAQTKPETGTAQAMATPSPEMQTVLDALKALGAKPLHTLTVEEARAQPTPADAVAVVMKDKGIDAGPAAEIKMRDVAIPGPGGEIKARIYTPPGAGPFPVIVYYHGGGWVIANLDTYDASARRLSVGAKAIVVSSHYRQGPEDVFPAAHEDAYAAYVWAVEHAGDFNGDAAHMALAGESAGGNLAANVAIMARDAKITQPLHQLLVYPVAGNDMTTSSYLENADAAPLGKADMAWFVENAFAKPDDAADPRINLVSRTDLSGLPPATVITAQIDPLRSEGMAYAKALEAAGVAVEMKNYDAVTHEFFGMGTVVPQAAQAMDYATSRLRQALTN
ncbi:alpha/beta hydrolase [Paragemmobacter aquarius]|nr:alpha/beta hydrolase [Gemmobacter aquarius]